MISKMFRKISYIRGTESRSMAMNDADDGKIDAIST